MLAALLLFGLSGCHPVETWRNLTGASNNEPNPRTTPNTQNLAAGAKLPYPNLATVPPPPTQGLTEAQIKKLKRSLLADRAHAKYTAESLAAAAPAPPPPPPAATGAAAATAATGLPVAPAGKKATSVASLGKKTKKAAASPGGRTPSAPLESSLTMPRIPAAAGPGAIPSSPPPPHLTSPFRKPASSVAMAPLPPLSARPVPPVPPVPPARSALPLPSPRLPALAAKPEIRHKARARKPLRLASITFPAGVTSLSPALRQQIATAAKRLRHTRGTLRVVTYASGGGGSLAELNSFGAALAEGQAVAAALRNAGIPKNRIKVVASPTKLPFGLSRVEILLVP